MKIKVATKELREVLASLKTLSAGLQPIEVAVVANKEGVTLYRSDNSAHEIQLTESEISKEGKFQIRLEGFAAVMNSASAFAVELHATHNQVNLVDNRTRWRLNELKDRCSKENHDAFCAPLDDCLALEDFDPGELSEALKIAARAAHPDKAREWQNNVIFTTVKDHIWVVGTNGVFISGRRLGEGALDCLIGIPEALYIANLEPVALDFSESRLRARGFKGTCTVLPYEAQPPDISRVMFSELKADQKKTMIVAKEQLIDACDKIRKFSPDAFAKIKFHATKTKIEVSSVREIGGDRKIIEGDHVTEIDGRSKTQDFEALTRACDVSDALKSIIATDTIEIELDNTTMRIADERTVNILSLCRE